MKIGIMSMQRINNYGSFWQAYCLKRVVEDLGQEIEFIDYHAEPCIAQKKEDTSKIKRYVKKVSKIFSLKNWKRKKSEILFKKRYNEEFLKELNITGDTNYNHDIDALIIGSDEVFNCLQTNPLIGYAKELFGKGYEDKKLISYAACFGSTNVERLKQYNIDKEVAEMLSKFKALSVRDENTYKTVKKLTGIEAQYNLDPVLIKNVDDKIPDIVKDNNYIILYAYPSRISKEEAKQIRKFAKENNKKIYSIGTFQECADKNIMADPFELLDYIRKADYIITDTFHGTVFSIKFNKQFATMIRDSNKEKLGDLLKRLKQENRKINDFSKLEKVIKKKIDYTQTNKIIEEERNKAIQYLKENLN